MGYSRQSALLANTISLRCSGNGNNAGRGGLEPQDTAQNHRQGVGPAAVNTLLRVCGHNVFVFQAEGTFC